MKIFFQRSLFIVALAFLAGATGASTKPAPARTIRVAVLKAVNEIRLSVSGPFEVSDASTRKSLWKGPNLSTQAVMPVPDGIKVGEKIFAVNSIVFSAQRPAGIIVNKRPYRGTVVISKNKDGLLLAVNVVELEFYVKGVLYHEISHKWPMDAIKAQAVATRTYAVYQQEAMKAQAYDVTADTSSQVYGGFISEKNKTNRGVNFTAGEVLLYKGKIFPAYFHATCGGMTENASELWKSDIEPLHGGQACSFCSASPHYFWKADMLLADIQKKCLAVCAQTGPLEGITIAERTSTGRARTLLFTDANGLTQTVSAKDVRRLLGADVLRSTQFSVHVKDGRAFFDGHGWGHGVGLCQWGALGMSKKGFSYAQILKFYYPGSTIRKLS